MRYYDTLVPYRVLPVDRIDYMVCRDFNHISRYRKLRQIAHNPSTLDRLVSLETPNTIESEVDFNYYVVSTAEENRLDIIAYRFLGSADYSWVLAYFNDIEDGYTVYEGQRIRIPKSFTDLFGKNEMLSSVTPTMLNLGYE